MKRLLLINPVGQKSGFLMSRFSTFSPLSLAYVAAVTPADWEVKIIDENFDRFTYEEADLVGITAFTSNINRAYEIAAIYKEQNTKVVLGGIHVSMFPEEGMRHADTVLVGEIENIWQTVLADFETGNLKQKYIGPIVDLNNFNIKPRRELLHPDYIWQSVQTSRGCPFDCHFCSVSRYLGRKYRKRRPSAVLDEIEGIDGQYITFVDDNLIGYDSKSRSRAKQIFEGMIQRKFNKKWFMQTSINAAEDESVLEAAAESGCMFALVGFETISTTALKEMKKGANLKLGIGNYKRAVDIFHSYGIAVMGAFIIGNDFESFEYYKKLADFLVKSNIDIVQITMLTPLPGTRLMEDMQAANRLVQVNFPQDWDKYRFSYMVHKPAGIDVDEIYTGGNYIKNHLYTFPHFQRRLINSFRNLKNTTNFLAVLKMNQAFKRGWKNSHYFKNYSVKLESDRIKVG